MAATRARIGVAFSGGLDSTALVHAAHAACAPLDVEVVALHVHHGLQPAADAWLERCADFCRTHAIAFVAQRLAGRPPKGASVEAWARTERYRALAAMARAAGIDLVLLAHHRRDQAETWLLQALRGAGVAGLAAMPVRQEREGITWARPWLDRPREAIAAYARLHGLPAVEDPSNADPRFDRSRLRTAVWPALVDAFPQAEATLAASAARAAEAAALVDEVAAEEADAASEGDALVVARWAGGTLARRAAALRAWLQRVLGRAAPATLVERLLRELDGRGPAAWPAPGGRLHRHRGRLRFVATPAPAAPQVVALALRRAGPVRVPAWGGRLVLTRVASGGVALADLEAVELRPRGGGERFQAGLGRPPRSLKKQWQAVGVPAWARGGPLLWAGTRLLFVPGLGIDARALAPPGVAQVAIDWRPDAAG